MQKALSISCMKMLSFSWERAVLFSSVMSPQASRFGCIGKAINEWILPYFLYCQSPWAPGSLNSRDYTHMNVDILLLTLSVSSFSHHISKRMNWAKYRRGQSRSLSGWNTFPVRVVRRVWDFQFLKETTKWGHGGEIYQIVHCSRQSRQRKCSPAPKILKLRASNAVDNQ